MALGVKKASSPLPSAKIDVQFFKDQTLGVGSYGKVCRAKYGSLPCAAKLMHETLFDPKAFKMVPQKKEHRLPFKRFEQECEVLHTLRHPNVIQYLGMYQDPDTNLPVLLMELMDYNLTHFLNTSLQQIPFHIHVNFCLDIALALSFLHANKVIHRDLSSNNVLLISNIRAKVTDFGMATLHVGEQATQFTRTMCPGTDAYMPPEAVKDKPVYKEKIDCFSLGVLIIQILTQLFPAPGGRQEEMELDHPGVPKGRKVMVTVPEMERRKNHIALIDPNHSLLAIAFDCLKDLESDRPSAQQICERVAALKESIEYVESIKEAGEMKLESSGGERQKSDETLLCNLREKEELMKAKEKDILQLKDLICSKDEALAAKEEEIKELKRQLGVPKPIRSPREHNYTSIDDDEIVNDFLYVQWNARFYIAML